MILTITPSPTLDLTYELDELREDQVNVSKGTLVEGSGKGILVAMALTEMGVPCEAMVPISDSELSLAWRDVVAKKIKVNITLAKREMRINTSLLHNGKTTKVNEVAKPLTSEECADFLKNIEYKVEDLKPSWIVLSGHISRDNVAAIVSGVKELSVKHNAKFVVDSSGHGLSMGIAAHPDFIKPNMDELIGIKPEAKADPVKAVLELAREIDGVVLLSNGDKPAYASDGNELYELIPAPIEIINSVGAGDSTVAGFVAAAESGKNFIESVINAMAWGQAACLTVESGGVKPELIDLASIKYKKLQ
jgi:1-phosphofructokinase family hexose kinase